MTLLDSTLRCSDYSVPVFPLAPRSKIPLVPQSKGGNCLYDATTDSAVVREWWTKHPDANMVMVRLKRSTLPLV